MTQTDERVTFRQQLTLLIAHTVNAQGKSYSLVEVAEGSGLSLQGLHYLLEGRNDSPRMETSYRLCEFFGVSLDYFDCATENECLSYLATQGRETSPSVITEIDQEVHKLSDKGRRNVFSMITLLSRLKGKFEKRR